MNSSACSADGRRRRKVRRFCRLAGLLTVGAIVLSSGETAPLKAAPTKSYQPDNFFAHPPWLPLTLRRVVVLPLAAQTTVGDLPEGCEALAPVLLEELVKTKRFEVVTVAADSLRRRTGFAQWTGAETLPPDFFAFLRREYDCDGVLFAELTSYRAYAPMAVGWRLKLVDARTGQILWAADELFDASQASVAYAAQHFGGQTSLWPFAHHENWVALNSPRRFGRYSAAALLAKLPAR